MSNTLDLTTLVLDSGGHSGPDKGMCLLEAASYMAGENWTDRPACVSIVLGAFGRNLNDRLPHDKRQLLIPLIPELLQTRGDGHDRTRSYMASDWLVHTALPAFLALSQRIDQADIDRVNALAPIIDRASADAAADILYEMRTKARATRRAAHQNLRDQCVKAYCGAAAVAVADAAAVAAADAAAAVAAADAVVAAAAAVAAADAVVAAAAGAVAAVADAVAAAAVVAADAAVVAADAADAADAAVDDAAAVAAAVDGGLYIRIRAAAKKAALEAVGPTSERIQDSAIDLYTRMIRVGR